MTILTNLNYGGKVPAVQTSDDMTGGREIDATKGVVFNIQRYSILDGPGIRTTIFVKDYVQAFP